jgi:hypothetical protein
MPGSAALHCSSRRVRAITGHYLKRPVVLPAFLPGLPTPASEPELGVLVVGVGVVGGILVGILVLDRPGRSPGR